MRKIRALTTVVLAVLLVSLTLASCANNLGDPDAINNYTPEVMTITTDAGVFTFENGEGDTAILVKYSGKATTNDHVEIPAKFGERTVVAIGSEAFYHLASIVEVKIPDTVTSIGDYAFAECTELPSIVLPDGVETIGRGAFEGCVKLTSVDLGESLVSVGEFAFKGCSALGALDLPATTSSIGDAAFWGCSGLTSLDLPDSVTTVGTLCFYDCTGLTSISLNKNLTEIGRFAFVTANSTLKDKIDPASYEGNEYVAQYVADIAEPTVETDTAAEAEAEAEE